MQPPGKVQVIRIRILSHALQHWYVQMWLLRIYNFYKNKDLKHVMHANFRRIASTREACISLQVFVTVSFYPISGKVPQ
jgi:hypothetical protein